MTADDAMAGKCGAAGRAGKPCGRPAGWGTDHPGLGYCKQHTGSTPNGRKHAAMLGALEVRAELALLVDIDSEADPFDTLMLAVRIARHEVLWYTMQIAGLDPDGVLERPLQEAMGGKDAIVADLRGREQVHPWIAAREKAVERAARYSKMAIDAGVDERRVAAEEQYANAIADALRQFMDQIHLTPEQSARAPSVLARVLHISPRSE